MIFEIMKAIVLVWVWTAVVFWLYLVLSILGDLIGAGMDAGPELVVREPDAGEHDWDTALRELTGDRS